VQCKPSCAKEALIYSALVVVECSEAIHATERINCLWIATGLNARDDGIKQHFLKSAKGLENA
jgi:hypothetical protein